MKAKNKEKIPVKIPDRSGYLRVTKILSVIRTGLDDFLEQGGETARSKIMEKAGYGTKVHSLCDLFNKGMKNGVIMEVDDIADESCSEKEIFSFSQYRKWVIENVEEIISSEKEVYNDTYKYYGHLDVVVRMRGDKNPSLVDIKTPENVSLTWFLQLEAYRRAYNECEVANPVKRCFALITTPAGCVVKESKTDKDFLFANFLYAKSLYQYMKPQGEKK